MTSDALNFENSRRGFRFVVFDIFGNVVARTAIEDAYSRSAQATAAMWKALNALDARAVTNGALDAFEKDTADEIAALRQKLSEG